MLSWVWRRATDGGAGPLDPDILSCLDEVCDPEIGIGIAALGLVYRAERILGRIEVDLTLTSRACPLGEVLREDVLTALRHRWADTPIVVNLVWSPAWTPERITDEGLRLLCRVHRMASLRPV